MSRIHLSLGYDPLNDEARSQIWENMFQKLKDDHKSGGTEIRYDYDAKQYVMKDPEVKALKWNGREIRNGMVAHIPVRSSISDPGVAAFQTAVALAVYDAKHNNKGPVPEITEQHLKQVVMMSAAFKKYVDAAHARKDHSTIAYEDGIRDDRASALPKV